MVAFQRCNQCEDEMMELRPATLLRICLTSSIGFSASTAVPIWVSGVGAHLGFPSWGAGAVATGQLACAALLNTATPWLFRGSPLRGLAYAAAAVALLGNGLAWVGSSFAFTAGCLLCGAGFGVLLNVANRLVAGSHAPQRGYAMVQFVEILFCIGFYLIVPALADRFGIFSVFGVLAALSATVFPLLAGAAELRATGSRAAGSKPAGTPPNLVAAVLSLCAAALLFAGYSAVNASLVPIGAAAGLSIPWVGRIMALGLIAGLGGALVARGLGERAGVLAPLLLGAGVLASDLIAITLGGGAIMFIGSALLLFLVMAFLVPYVFTLLAGLDEAGRWASIGPGFVLTGAALGPAIAGVEARGMDFARVGYCALACVAAAMTLFLGAQRLRAIRASLARA